MGSSHSSEPYALRQSAVSVTNTAETYQRLHRRSHCVEELPIAIVYICVCNYVEESAQESTNPQRVSNFPIFHETKRYVSMLYE